MVVDAVLNNSLTHERHPYTCRAIIIRVLRYFSAGKEKRKMFAQRSPTIPK